MYLVRNDLINESNQSCKQIYDQKLPLVKSCVGIDKKLDRPFIHNHHIYMHDYIFFWMLRAQIIRICNVGMKIWGSILSSGTFSQWLSRKKMPPKKRNFRITTSNHQRYTQFASRYMFQFTSRYMFLRMTNTMMLIKNSLRIKKDVKIPDVRQLWPKKNRCLYEVN